MTQGALPLDPTKGSSTLWTPFRAIELVTTAYNARVFIQRTFGSKKKQYPKSMRVAAEGVKGAIADFVCFRCPLVAPAGAKSLRYSAFTSAFTSANWLSTSDSFTTDDGE